MASAESALRSSVADLNAVKARWALVGGLAVSARTVPRFTKDLDFAIAVAKRNAYSSRHNLRGRSRIQARGLPGSTTSAWCALFRIALTLT